jgi:hypothetical protein
MLVHLPYRPDEFLTPRSQWAARRAIVIAPSFYGESSDLVRAGLLVTRYLLHTRKLTESWLTISFAMRMAQAQGMHVRKAIHNPLASTKYSHNIGGW